MKFGVCTLSVIPVRRVPNDRSEMVTQVIFGELFTIIEKIENWLFIRMVHDNYEGWIDEKQITYLDEKEFQTLSSTEPARSTDLVQIISNHTQNTLQTLVIGSSIYARDGKPFKIKNEEFSFEGSLTPPHITVNNKQIIENVFIYKNAPYLWGGRSPYGIDCSGLTQMAYLMAGIKIHRDASQQASQGETVNFISEATPGDLLFFDNEDGLINHTGILLPKNKIIHASGNVRIDKVDHQGIFNKESKQYSHKLRLIKKLI